MLMARRARGYCGGSDVDAEDGQGHTGRARPGGRVKYLPLIWAALTRRKLRTILTLLSVTAAFTLFGVTMGTDAAFQRMVEVINRTVVVTFARFADNLTDAMGQQIAAMPNVAAISASGAVCGYHRSPKNRAC